MTSYECQLEKELTHKNINRIILVGRRILLILHSVYEVEWIQFLEYNWVYSKTDTPRTQNFLKGSCRSVKLLPKRASNYDSISYLRYAKRCRILPLKNAAHLLITALQPFFFSFSFFLLIWVCLGISKVLLTDCYRNE